VSQQQSPARWNVAAAISGWLVPGLGHILLGQRRRGTILMLTIGLLWLSGLAIGGITVIDYQEKTWWFLGQMLTAPTLAVNWYHQQLPNTAVEPSLARIAEQGTLYVTLAGLLNLVAMLDVLYRDPNDPRHAGDDADAQREGEAAAASQSDASSQPEQINTP
jgi:TM2 domain-containing membrane protein YozV